MPDNPSYTDGKAGVADPTVENLCVLVSSNPITYHYISDSLKMEGVTIEHRLEGEGDLLGSDTKSAGAFKGSMNLQLYKATDGKPLPGHILRFTKGSSVECYVVTDMPADNKRGDVLRISPALTQVIHPVFQGLLSQAEGQTYRLTKSISTGGPTSTLATTPINHRTGSTKAYSALQSNGSALPAGVAINASTGVITFTHASLVAGTYTIIVTATDTLAPYSDREGYGVLVLSVTA